MLFSWFEGTGQHKQTLLHPLKWKLCEKPFCLIVTVNGVHISAYNYALYKVKYHKIYNMLRYTSSKYRVYVTTNKCFCDMYLLQAAATRSADNFQFGIQARWFSLFSWNSSFFFSSFLCNIFYLLCHWCLRHAWNWANYSVNIIQHKWGTFTDDRQLWN